MKHNCPACGADLSRHRSLMRSVIPRMALDCPACRARIEVNVHPVESWLMVASFLGFVACGVIYYASGREGFVVAALACLAPAGVLPMLERYWFRDWPRYR
jgi:hypothetical protein